MATSSVIVFYLGLVLTTSHIGHLIPQGIQRHSGTRGDASNLLSYCRASGKAVHYYQLLVFDITRPSIKPGTCESGSCITRLSTRLFSSKNQMGATVQSYLYHLCDCIGIKVSMVFHKEIVFPCFMLHIICVFLSYFNVTSASKKVTGQVIK